MNKTAYLVALMILMNILWIGVVVWVGGSLIISGVKAFSDDCGTKYGIETVVAGDWFCSEQTNN